MSVIRRGGKWPAIALLALCEVMAMALWFSASAILPALRAEFILSDFQAALIASSVAAGFVAGTLASALLGLADRLEPRRFFMIAALTAATANIGLLVAAPTGLAMPALRFVVGAAMAGVYPVGVKMAASWSDGDRGLLVGLLVGALTLGTASPHLIDALGGLDWRFTLAVSSGLGVTAGLMILLFRPGPHISRTVAFRTGDVFKAWTDRGLRLANLGYFGHMWELYAMWAWIGIFLDASFRVTIGGAHAAMIAKLVTFATIGVGAVGCLAGGYLADRIGRTTLTMAAMAVSGGCALTVGFLFDAGPWLLSLLCLVWGLSVVADSAQFSSSVLELADPELAGTMVTVQTSIGFLLTMVTIHLLPAVVGAVGWRYGFMFLAIGPFLGVVAMGRLRARPEALRLAGGRR